MELKTLMLILKWFDEYQWDEDVNKMKMLYEKLIEEEQDELLEAIKNKDIVEILDAIWDILWVSIWYIYFNWWIALEVWYVEDDSMDIILSMIKWNISAKKLLNILMMEIVTSNYSKIKQKEHKWEKIWKILKWPNFIRPDINKIVKDYKLVLK